MQPKSTLREPGQAPLPSSDVRGWVSLALFIHLFAVAIALASYGNPSTIQERLRTVMGPYLATLNFDLNPNAYPTGRFYLTHDLPTDYNAVIHVDAKLPDGSERSITIPEAGLWPPERRRHYQALANSASTLVESDDYQATLPKSIAGAILRAWGASAGNVSIERNGRGEGPRSDPFEPLRHRTEYEAHVLVSRSGQVDLVKKVAAGETAPVDKTRQDKNPADENPSDGQPADGNSPDTRSPSKGGGN
jgi:hypothetical protein